MPPESACSQRKRRALAPRPPPPPTFQPNPPPIPCVGFTLTGTGEPALKRLAKQTDAAVGAVQALLVERLMPSLDRLTFLLSEMQGLARCRPWKGAFGLTVRLQGRG